MGVIARPTRGFTLVEVLVASVVCALIAGATAAALGQIAQVKERSLARRQAFARAHAAASRIAADVASAVRHSDLRFAKVQVIDGGASSDEVLVLSRSLRRVRSPDMGTEGGVYEVHYRVLPPAGGGTGHTLARRVDPAFDPAIDGGGVVEVGLADVRSLTVQATDGESWFDTWDSDSDGLPHGLRITVEGVSDDGRVTAVARRVASLDQVPVPPQTEADEDAQGEEQPASGTSGGTSGATSGTTGGGARP